MKYTSDKWLTCIKIHQMMKKKKKDKKGEKKETGLL